MNPVNRFISPTDDVNRSGGEGIINVNVTGNMNEMANRTGTRLFQTVAEPPRSSELIVSSVNRIRGTPYDFTTDIGGPLYRARTARLAAAIMPAIPNINRQNNTVTMQFCSDLSSTGTYEIITRTFTIPVGYYTSATFSNIFAALVHDVISALITDKVLVLTTLGGSQRFLNSMADLTVTVHFEEETFKPILTVSAVNTVLADITETVFFTSAGNRIAYWFDEECSFIKRGIHMVPFKGAQVLEGPVVVPIGGDTVRSLYFPTNASSQGTTVGGIIFQRVIGNPASLYYTRFITILSENLCLYTFGESRLDRQGGGGGTGKIIGVYAVARYNGNTNGPFAGVDVVKGVEGPVLGINNAQLKLNEFIDFRFEDEFGFSLGDVFPLDTVRGPTLAFNITY